jgi:multiple sugar transport system ATP-binding protein
VFYLVLENVTKAFKKTKVIGDASLTLERGESVVIVGPSGAGKTVLLRLIAGIYPIDSGDIRIDGRSVAGLPPEARGVGMAFQNFALYPHLSARENIASPLRARGLGDAEVRKRVGDVAELLKIAHVLEHEPRRLSNGQKQRTALARALVSGASLQMLDDPLRNVDAKLRYEMRFELPRLLKTFGASVLYVTQDYREAMAFGDRIAVLADGRFVQVDRPAAIYGAPATVEIARLFGDPTINTYHTRPRVNGHGTVIDLLGSSIALAGPIATAPPGECVVAIRPEHVEVHLEPAPGRIPMELDTVTPLNFRAAMLLRSKGGEELLATTDENAAARLPRRRGIVHVAVDPKHLLLFDAASRIRLDTER